MKILSPTEFVEILKKHYIQEHGVINLAGAIDEMFSREIDVERSCSDLYQNQDFADWHCQALVILRSLLVRGKISQVKTVKLLLEMTKRFGQVDFDEFYRTIDAFSHSPRYSKKLLDLVDYFTTAPISDRRWFAFYTIATLLETKTAISSKRARKLLRTLTSIAERESEVSRKSQMLEVMGKLRARMEE